jgi:hypothetical protein
MPVITMMAKAVAALVMPPVVMTPVRVSVRAVITAATVVVGPVVALNAP